jgi:hypothetical protein
MGTKDSSKTRVAPVFDQLMAMDETGAAWLDRLIALGSRRDIAEHVPKGQRLVAAHPKHWGSTEASLPAPAALLEHLVQHLDPKRLAMSQDTGATLEKRTALAQRDPLVTAEALRLLRQGDRGRQWFVLEGESRPDALLEAQDVVLCVEGKRTEAACTTETTWMECRSQLVRHMDAATEKFRNKRVLGLLIVEGKGEPSTCSSHWVAQSAAQYDDAMLRGSLPHRTSEERDRIAGGMLGVTTWQTVCSTFGIAWPPAPDLT